MFYGLEKMSRIPAVYTSEIGIGDGGKWIRILVFSAAEQERGHHCIESERPSAYKILNLRIR